MAIWSLYNYAELNGKNKIAQWIEALPQADQARIDTRLLAMSGMRDWPDKWVSKYKSSGTIYEFRIKGLKVQYRPHGNYYGELKYIILSGAVEKDWKIPSDVVKTALDRWKRVCENEKHSVPHKFDTSGDLAEDEE